MYAAASWWQRHEHALLRRVLERALTPIAVALVLASAMTLLRALHPGALVLGTTAAVALLQGLTRISPYAVMGAVAAVYMLLFALR
jgi:chromate transporter